MKCKIETSNGIMFLKGLDGDKRLEIADYIELHDYFTKPQSFYAKSAELEVILTDVGCFEMQNAASANQSSRDRGQVRVLPPRFFVTFELIFLNIPAGQ